MSYSRSSVSLWSSHPPLTLEDSKPLVHYICFGMEFHRQCIFFHRATVNVCSMSHLQGCLVFLVDPPRLSFPFTRAKHSVARCMVFESTDALICPTDTCIDTNPIQLPSGHRFLEVPPGRPCLESPAGANKCLKFHCRRRSGLRK